MSDLDFSALSDDQVLNLARAAIQEMVARGAATEAAMRDAMLDEAEKASIARRAAEQEASVLRARERERVAKEAADAVRAAHAKASASASAQAAAAAATAAREREESRQRTNKKWLSEAGALVGRLGAEISILLVNTHYGRRVLINPGSDRYERNHLVDYSVDNQTIKTSRALVKSKIDLVAFCAKFAHGETGQIAIMGNNYDWSTQ